MNKFKRQTVRGLVAAIPLALSICYCYFYIPISTKIDLDIEDLMGAGEDQSACSLVGEKIAKLTKLNKEVRLSLNLVIGETLESLIKLPKDLLKYELRARNLFKYETKEGDKTINTILRIDINNNYEEIGYAKSEGIFVIQDSDNFKIDKIEYSFKSSFGDGDGKEIPPGTPFNFIEGKRHISLFFRPTFPTFLIILSALLISCYSVLLLVAGYYNFVVSGRPFLRNNQSHENIPKNE